MKMGPAWKNFHYFLFILTYILNFSETNGIQCVKECNCFWMEGRLNVDCSNRNLNEVPDLLDLPVENLDLSNNRLGEFPTELSEIFMLEILNLSNNNIDYLRRDSLKGFSNLRKLILDNNNFTHWINLNPNHVLLPAVNLQEFSLSGNNLQYFSTATNNDFSLILLSNSLQTLKLSDCNIKNFSGQSLLSGLPHLQNLILNNNPFKLISDLYSDNLQLLDLSECNLKKFNFTVLQNFKKIITLNLSGNPGLILKNLKQANYYRNYLLISGSMKYERKEETIPDAGSERSTIYSESLKILDLSHCNMDSVEIDSFPSLITLILKYNMITKLTSVTFNNNPRLENIDLSNNAIQQISIDTFTNLKSLKTLNLSFNTISTIDVHTFRYNEMLTILDLSQNYLSKLNKLIIKSLTKLIVSGCEITNVDKNALTGLPKITSINLSYNLVSNLPSSLESDTLQELDLSMCRISSISNTTFQNFPNLITLKLSGNRFTTPFRSEYFRYNRYLSNLWLGDNPWICDCRDENFEGFYKYLTDRPRKIRDGSHLRCASPENLYGIGWETACFYVWFPDNKSAATEKVWTIIMLSIVLIAVFLFFISCIKRYIDKRKIRRNREEYRRNVSEQRAIMRHNMMILEQEAQLNAPDPRETLPPCYEDALQMPRLTGTRNFKSLEDVNPRRSKHKIQSAEEDEGLILDRFRFRSEAMISASRASERTANINATRRTGDMFRSHTSSSGLCYIEDSKFSASYIKTQNLQSAEKLANFQSYESSPYSKKKPIGLHNANNSSSSLNSFSDARHVPLLKDFSKKFLDSNSIEIIGSFESIQRSPYSRRKPKKSSDKAGSVSFIHRPAEITRNNKDFNGSEEKIDISNEELNIVENFYGERNMENFGLKSEKSYSNSGDSSEFEIMDESATNNNNSAKDSSKSSKLINSPVIVHYRKEDMDQSAI